MVAFTAGYLYAEALKFARMATLDRDASGNCVPRARFNSQAPSSADRPESVGLRSGTSGT